MHYQYTFVLSVYVFLLLYVIMCLHFKCVDIVRLLLILGKCDIVLANHERWYWYGRIENIHR